MSDSIRVVVALTYPEKTTDIKVPIESTLGNLREAAGKALKQDLSEYSLSLASLGEDVVPLSGKDDTKLTLKADSTLVVITPASMLPARKKKDEKEDSKDEDRYKGLSPENIFAKLAKLTGKQRQIAFEYLDTFTSEIFQSKAWLRLPKANVAAVIKRDSLNAAESEIFDAVLAWANESLKKKGEKPSTEGVKTAIGDLLYLIRFPLMTTEEIAAKITPANLLSPQQVLELFTYLAQKDLGGKPGDSLAVFSSKPRQGSGRYGKAGSPMGEDCFKVTRMDGSWSYGAYDNCHSSNSVSNSSDLDLVTNFFNGRSLSSWKGSGDDYNLPRGSSTSDRCGIYSYPSSEHGLEFTFQKGTALIRSFRFLCTRLERGVTMRVMVRKKGASWSADLNTVPLPFLSNGGGQKQWVEINFGKPQTADELRLEIRGGQCAMHCVQFINGP